MTTSSLRSSRSSWYWPPDSSISVTDASATSESSASLHSQPSNERGPQHLAQHGRDLLLLAAGPDLLVQLRRLRQSPGARRRASSLTARSRCAATAAAARAGSADTGDAVLGQQPGQRGLAVGGPLPGSAGRGSSRSGWRWPGPRAAPPPRRSALAQAAARSVSSTAGAPSVTTESRAARSPAQACCSSSASAWRPFSAAASSARLASRLLAGLAERRVGRGDRRQRRGHLGLGQRAGQDGGPASSCSRCRHGAAARRAAARAAAACPHRPACALAAASAAARASARLGGSGGGGARSTGCRHTGQSSPTPQVLGQQRRRRAPARPRPRRPARPPVPPRPPAARRRPVCAACAGGQLLFLPLQPRGQFAAQLIGRAEHSMLRLVRQPRRACSASSSARSAASSACCCAVAASSSASADTFGQAGDLSRSAHGGQQPGLLAARAGLLGRLFGLLGELAEGGQLVSTVLAEVGQGLDPGRGAGLGFRGWRRPVRRAALGVPRPLGGQPGPLAGALADLLVDAEGQQLHQQVLPFGGLGLQELGEPALRQQHRLGEMLVAEPEDAPPPRR